MLQLVKSFKLLSTVLCILAALSLSACGKKGPLELPSSSSSAQDTADSKDASSQDAASAKEETEPKKPQRSFFLDGLLQ